VASYLECENELVGITKVKVKLKVKLSLCFN
jgi:hypothetical protein